MEKRIAFLFILFSLAFSISATAQNKRIAVFETVDSEDTIPYSIELMVRSNLTGAVSSLSGYDGYDAMKVSDVLDEQAYQGLGTLDEEQIRRLGEATKAEYLLFSEVVRYDEKNVFVMARLLNAETAKTEGSENALMGMTADDIQHGCESLVKKLLILSSRFDKTPQKPKQGIGEIVSFPDGTKGVVFYMDDNGKGLAVSLNESLADWDNSFRIRDIVPLYNVEKGESFFNYGEGEKNTQAILSALGNKARAAYWCNLQGEGWYLPSCGELHMLMKLADEDDAFINALRSAGGGEIDGWYWSSTERNNKDAWNVKSGGRCSSEEKKERERVRAVRAFSSK